MKQRLGIAQALLHRPDLVVLDEPTSGLDPGGMKDVRELIRELGRQGTTVFLSSHLLHEVELVCTRAAIVNRGRVIVRGPGQRAAPGRHGDQAAGGRPAAGRGGPGRTARRARVLGRRRRTSSSPCRTSRCRSWCAGWWRADVDVRAVVPAPERGLEDVFLELTGEDDAARNFAPPRRGMLAALRRGGRAGGSSRGAGPGGAS